MIKNLPSISAQIDEKLINQIIQNNFSLLAPAFFTLTSNWFIRAYDHFKDIDKFVIIIYLINKDLIFFRKNGVKIDYETFYRDKSIEIDKINISDISKDLNIPKESTRRKILDLEKSGVIKKNGKKIFIVRDTILDIIDVKPVYFSDTKAVLKGIPDGTIMLSKSVPGAYAGMAVKPYNSNASE